MHSEQDRLLMFLKGPDNYAHQSGQEMLSVLNSGKRKRHLAMNKVADGHFENILNLFDKEQCSRILCTWLRTFQLPLNPQQLKSFDKFHQNVGKFVLNNSQKIRSY